MENLIDSLVEDLINRYGFNRLTALSIIMRSLAESKYKEEETKKKVYDLAEFVSIILQHNS